MTNYRITSRFPEITRAADFAGVYSVETPVVALCALLQGAGYFNARPFEDGTDVNFAPRGEVGLRGEVGEWEIVAV